MIETLQINYEILFLFFMLWNSNYSKNPIVWIKLWLTMNHNRWLHYCYIFNRNHCFCRMKGRRVARRRREGRNVLSNDDTSATQGLSRVEPKLYIKCSPHVKHHRYARIMRMVYTSGSDSKFRNKTHIPIWIYRVPLSLAHVFLFVTPKQYNNVQVNKPIAISICHWEILCAISLNL